jgi:PAS domain S-box-containing protein
MTKSASDDAIEGGVPRVGVGRDTYRPVDPLLLWRRGSGRERLAVLGAWVATLLLSIGLGLASIVFSWSGIPLHFGGVDFYVTIYPPLVLSLFWVLWFGFWWGFVPAYLSTLALALYSGMPLGWSLIFAFADPLGLAVFAIAYRAIPVSFALRSVGSVLFFVQLAFVAGIFGSAGSFVWTYTNRVAVHELLPIWQGWWVGAFLQDVLLVAPLLALTSPAVMAWRDRRLWTRPLRHEARREILLMGATILGGVLLYLYCSMQLGAWQLHAALASADQTAWRKAAQTMAESTDALYWVVFIIVLFLGFFGYQLFTHWTASLKDSARRLAEVNRNLREQHGLHQALVDAQTEIGEGLAILENERFVFANEALCRLSGYTEEQLKAMSSFLDLIHPGTRERVRSNYVRRLSGERLETRYEVPIVTRTGETVETEIGVSLQGVGQGARTIVVISDNRQRKLAERALRDAKEAAERSDAAKSRFLAAASHDLRQPLQALIMFVSVLRKRHPDPESQSLIGMMDFSIQALKELLDTLLDISKLEAGVITPDKQSVPVDYLFTRLDNEFRLQVEHKGLQFRVHPPRREVSIYTDPALLLMVLRNLLSNAARHTDRGGIVLGCRLRPDHVAIQVWDSGAGIPAEELDKIFQEFYQLSNSARDRRKGLGLGLAIVDRVARLQGTPVRVRSRVGKGTLFEVAVPYGKDAAPAEENHAAGAGSAPDGRILVIDDDPVVLLATTMQLESLGYEVLAAGGLEEAIGLIEEGKEDADLILTDYRLEGPKTGYDAIEAIRARLGPVPGILITGDTAPQRLQEAQRSGYRVLHKPVDLAQLEAAIAQAMPRERHVPTG